MVILKLNSNYGDKDSLPDQTSVRLLLNLLLGLCAHFLIKSRSLLFARTLLSPFNQNLPLNPLLDIWSLSISNPVSPLPPSPRWPWPVLSKNLIRPVYPDLPLPLMLLMAIFHPLTPYSAPWLPVLARTCCTQGWARSLSPTVESQCPAAGICLHGPE